MLPFPFSGNEQVQRKIYYVIIIAAGDLRLEVTQDFLGQWKAFSTLKEENPDLTAINFFTEEHFTIEKQLLASQNIMSRHDIV